MFQYLQQIYKISEKWSSSIPDDLKGRWTSSVDVSSEQIVLVASPTSSNSRTSACPTASSSRDLTSCSPIVCHTIVSELDPFPVKKSQKLVTADVLLSSWGVCLTQMLLSVEPLRLEQLPLLPTLSEKPSWPLRSWSWLWSLEEDGWPRLRRLWWEWNWRMWRMDFPGAMSPSRWKNDKNIVERYLHFLSSTTRWSCSHIIKCSLSHIWTNDL